MTDKTTEAGCTTPATGAVGSLVDQRVGRPVDSRVTACTGFAQVVDGPRPQTLEWDDEDEWGDEDEPSDKCPHCRGDGADPDCDYLLPCPDCGGSW